MTMNALDAGTMSSVPASANDPIFLSHHTMIDYIFEQWLLKNPTAAYVGPDTRGKYPNLKGHGPTDTLIPFIPLVSNNQAFKPASSFGYQYASAAGGGLSETAIVLTSIGSILAFLLFTVLIVCGLIIGNKKRNHRLKYTTVN